MRRRGSVERGCLVQTRGSGEVLASSPVAGRVVWCGSNRVKTSRGAQVEWRPRSPAEETEPPDRSRQTTEGGAQPAPKTSAEPKAKARLQIYGSRAPAQRRPPLHLASGWRQPGCRAMPTRYSPLPTHEPSPPFPVKLPAPRTPPITVTREDSCSAPCSSPPPPPASWLPVPPQPRHR